MTSIFELSSPRLNSLDLGRFNKSKICVLGGTGFIGTYLVNCLNQASLSQDVDLEVTIYTRSTKMASNKFPHLNFERFKFVEFDFLKGGCDLGIFDFFINGATPTSTKPGDNSKSIFYYPTMNAIQSIIDSARKYENNPRVLNLSSGAVYGPQPMRLALRTEGPAKTPESSDDDYCASKIDSENLLIAPEVVKILRATSPRLFTFYGPGLHIDQHFAIGNFIRDGLMGLPIKVQGNPDTRRSYMFPTDLVIWLIEAILDPKPEYLNIGSENAISMHDLASLISSLTSKKDVVLVNPSTTANNYVPSTANFRSLYNVNETVELEDGLHSWVSWLSKMNRH